METAIVSDLARFLVLCSRFRSGGQCLFYHPRLYNLTAPKLMPVARSYHDVVAPNPPQNVKLIVEKKEIFFPKEILIDCDRVQYKFRAFLYYIYILSYLNEDSVASVLVQPTHTMERHLIGFGKDTKTVPQPSLFNFKRAVSERANHRERFRLSH